MCYGFFGDPSRRFWIDGVLIASCLVVLESSAISHLYFVEVCPSVTPGVVVWLRKWHQRIQ